MRKIDEIIIHCSATRTKWLLPPSSGDEGTTQWDALEAQFAEIRRWHVDDEGYDDIGYHWVIGRNGAVKQGREEKTQGAHCLAKGKNRGTIGICLVGGFGSDATDKFEDHFTKDQEGSLRRLLMDIEERHEIKRVKGHNDYANRACPGFKVQEWI